MAAGSAVGSAVGEAVDDSASWAKEKRQSVIMHTKKTTVHIVEQVILYTVLYPVYCTL